MLRPLALGIGYLLASMLSLSAQQRGDVASVSLIRSFDQAELATLYDNNGIPRFVSPIEFAVDAYRVVYYTASATGDSLTLASGLMAVPQENCESPLFCYHHGTAYYGNLVSDLELEWQVGVVTAANGYLAVLPDYLGYGATPPPHPHAYLHAESEASASVDLLRAARHWCQEQAVSLNGQLFLAGYSQGGHAAMATHRAIETLHSQEFTVTASAPGSGPYDLSGLTREALLAPAPSISFYLAFTMFSYQYVYGDLWDDPSEAFVAPFDQLLPQFFDRTTPPVAVPFPDTARNMLQPTYLAAVQQDSLHPANLALKANDLYDWIPQAPINMYYCEADEVVPYQNALLAENTFQQNGATNVRASSSGQNLGHEACAVPTFLGTKLWLDSFREACTQVSRSTQGPGSEIVILPNPSSGSFILKGKPHAPGAPFRVTLSDLQGRAVRRWTEPQRTYRVGALSRGIYLITVEENETRWQGKLVIQPR